MRDTSLFGRGGDRQGSGFERGYFKAAVASPSLLWIKEIGYVIFYIFAVSFNLS